MVVWAHDCFICNHESREMVASHNGRKDKDAIVLGVSIDGMEQIKEAREFGPLKSKDIEEFIETFNESPFASQ